MTRSLRPRALARAAHSRVGFRLRRLRRRSPARPLAGRRLISAFADANPAAFFVEIGSNDGEQHDHLRPFILDREWSGIMVEPVPYVFERLSKNYRDLDRVILENVAVGARDGELPFYHLVDASAEERAALPDWYDGIGSFSREVVLGHSRHIPDVEHRLVTAQVPTVTFDSLCARNGIDRLDLLVIDTEGYDWEILRNIDLSAWRPQLVVYEHYHLPEVARTECAVYLRRNGYETMEEGFDTFCVEGTVRGPVRSTWNELRPVVAGVAKHDEGA